MNAAFAAKTNLSHKYQSLLTQIDFIVKQITEEKNNIEGTGLLAGAAGITLLFAYLSKVFPDKKYGITSANFLDTLSHALENEVLPYNMSGGVAGIGFVFQHLKNISALGDANDFDLSDLDEFIDRGIDADFNSGNWDPLHGMTGLGIYFLERNEETGEKKFLEKIVDRVALLKKSLDGNDVWITPGYQKYSDDNYNFGMAHGIPGLLSFFAHVHARGIRKKEIENMITSCFSWLLQQELVDDAVYSFPLSLDVTPKEDKENIPGRLAWCYGDLCMANALIYCGKALHNDDWLQKGIQVALKTTQRTFENSGVTDAPFCHGSVGLVHQYNRLHQFTGNDVFKNACDYWIDITLQKFYKAGEGAGGYFFQSYNEERASTELKTEYGLLEGSTGIALVYLSLLYNIAPEWDRVFLTNIS